MEALTWPECNALAKYNTERARGIVHSDAWKSRMRDLQERFDAVGVAQSEKEWLRETKRGRP